MDNLVREYFTSQIRESIQVKSAILEMPDVLSSIEMAAAYCVQCLNNGGRILIAGNGGSAADAQHIAAEFVSRFYFDRPGLPAMALTTDTSVLTAIGNDYGYERIFERQLQANGRKGDVFIGISTSGNSPNVLRAMREARSLGVTSIGMTGTNGTKLKEASDLCIQVPSDSTPRIQEAHIVIGHAICAFVEKSIFSKEKI